MKLGVDDPKKMMVLGALVVVGGYLKFSDVFSSAPAGPAASTSPAAARKAPVPADVPQPARPVARSSRSRVQSDEFRPVLHSKRPEERIEPAKVDPTLRLDLLAKVQDAGLSVSGRNVFQFGQAPLPPEPTVKPKPVQPAPAPAAVAAAAAAPPGPPPPPPITLRYYGFSSTPGSSARTAFFLDGEDILVAKEGETLKRRYRVVRIGATSVVMEDTESKRQQTLALAEEAAG